MKNFYILNLNVDEHVVPSHQVLHPDPDLPGSKHGAPGAQEPTNLHL